MILKKTTRLLHRLYYASCYRLLIFILTIIVGNVFLTSCTTTKKNSLYFENLPKDTLLRNLVTKDFELKIAKGDLVNIGVSSLSTEGSVIFNEPQIATTGSATAIGGGYLVDIDGNILYPKLGILHVDGLTRDELRNRLLKELTPYLKEPVITVNFVNHKITMLGEVAKPGVLSMPGEEMTIIDAIGLSGELTKIARKDNILVIRKEGADKQFKRINLNNSSIFYSPYYFLRPDDIVYVEEDPKKTKGPGNSAQILSYVFTGISLIYFIVSRIK